MRYSILRVICFDFFVPARRDKTFFFFFLQVFPHKQHSLKPLNEPKLTKTRAHSTKYMKRLTDGLGDIGYPFSENVVALHDLIVESSVIFLQVRGLAVRTARRLPLEQVLASLAEHVFLEDGRLKQVKHLPNTRTLGTLARGLWDYGDVPLPERSVVIASTQ